MAADTDLAIGTSVVLVLAGAALRYTLDVLPEEIEIVRGDDNGSWPDQDNLLAWAQQIIAVAPPPFDLPYYARLLDAVRKLRIEVPSGSIYGLVQPPMPCGIGACQACLVRCGKQEVAACLDGPAFDLLSLTALPTESAS
jgi:hypothetical protein